MQKAICPGEHMVCCIRVQSVLVAILELEGKDLLLGTGNPPQHSVASKKCDQTNRSEVLQRLKHVLECEWECVVCAFVCVCVCVYACISVSSMCARMYRRSGNFHC